MAGQCPFRYPGNWSTVIPSTPGPPSLARTRFNASIRFSRSHTSSITRWFSAGLSASLPATGVPVPSCPSKQASLAPANQKASCFWFFCRLPLMRFESYLPLQFVRAFIACAPHRILVHRLACLFHASFRPRFAATPLRFTNPSPPSGWVEDFHFLAAGHAQHTLQPPFRRLFAGDGSLGLQQ